MTTEPIARINVEWKLEKAEFAEFNMSTCGKIAVWLSAVQRKNEKDSLCGRVMMAWIELVWINAMVFVSMAQAPPKAGVK